MGLAFNVVSGVSARGHQVVKKCCHNARFFHIVLDLITKMVGVVRKKHQGSRFMIECAKVFTQKVMKVPR